MGTLKGEKEKLSTAIFVLFVINITNYICLLYASYCFIKYDLFHKTVLLVDYRILILPLSYCVMLLCILISYFVVDIEAEPLFSIFKPVGKLDFYVRVFIVICTFILLKETVNINNSMYLYLFLSFLINFYLESKMKKITNNTSDAEIEKIISNNTINFTEQEIKLYKQELKKGTIALFLVCSTVFFNFILKNMLITVIFFFIYSTINLHLLNNTYFLLYGIKNAIKNGIKKSVKLFKISKLLF